MTNLTTADERRTTPAAPHNGRFSLDLATETWWWSDQVYAIHGFTPHEVVPTTDLLLAHQHPDDQDDVRRRLTDAVRDGTPFTAVNRILDARGDERIINTVAEVDTERRTLTGHVVDLTPVVTERARAMADEAIAASARNRATIEQAVGAVALSEGVTVEQAFLRLRTASNHANVPVRTLARAIVEQLPCLGRAPGRLAGLLRDLTAPKQRA